MSSDPSVKAQAGFRPTHLVLLLLLALSGCGVVVAGTMTLANHLDQMAGQKAVAKLHAKQVRQIKALQAAGDPMGDYLFALANAEGWIGKDRVADPLTIMNLYARAAEKGSSDAMIALGLMLFDGRGAPQSVRDVSLPKERRDWKRGLEWIERGMKQRCSYAQPLFDPRSGGRLCMVYRSPASSIWPAFRDASVRAVGNDTAGAEIGKNKALEDHWRQQDRLCEASAEVVRTRRDCQIG